MGELWDGVGKKPLHFGDAIGQSGYLVTALHPTLLLRWLVQGLWLPRDRDCGGVVSVVCKRRPVGIKSPGGAYVAVM